MVLNNLNWTMFMAQNFSFNLVLNQIIDWNNSPSFNTYDALTIMTCVELMAKTATTVFVSNFGSMYSGRLSPRARMKQQAVDFKDKTENKNL